MAQAQLFENDPIKRHATFSDDRVFRYTLMRTWGSESKCCFVMLNPSIADASIDDPTIRRCMGFARAWGHGGLIVVNLFAFRSTDPALMIAEYKKGADIIGPANDLNIIQSCKMAARVVAAWGAHGALGQRSTFVRKLLADREITVHCLGLTKLNEPQHPLYIEGERPLQPLGPVTTPRLVDATGGRSECSKEFPMPTGSAGRWAHPDAKAVGDGEYSQRYLCPHCGLSFAVELPE